MRRGSNATPPVASGSGCWRRKERWWPSPACYDTTEELALLNEIYMLLRLQTNFFAPPQKLVEKHRVGATVTKCYGIAATPYQWVLPGRHVTAKTKTALTRQYKSLNPARVRHELLDLQDQLLKLAKTTHQATKLPVNPRRLRGQNQMGQ